MSSAIIFLSDLAEEDEVTIYSKNQKYIIPQYVIAGNSNGVTVNGQWCPPRNDYGLLANGITCGINAILPYVLEEVEKYPSPEIYSQLIGMIHRIPFKLYNLLTGEMLDLIDGKKGFFSDLSDRVNKLLKLTSDGIELTKEIDDQVKTQRGIIEDVQTKMDSQVWEMSEATKKLDELLAAVERVKGMIQVEKDFNVSEDQSDSGVNSGRDEDDEDNLANHEIAAKKMRDTEEGERMILPIEDESEKKFDNHAQELHDYNLSGERVVFSGSFGDNLNESTLFNKFSLATSCGAGRESKCECWKIYNRQILDDGNYDVHFYAYDNGHDFNCVLPHSWLRNNGVRHLGWIICRNLKAEEGWIRGFELSQTLDENGKNGYLLKGYGRMLKDLFGFSCNEKGVREVLIGHEEGFDYQNIPLFVDSGRSQKLQLIFDRRTSIGSRVEKIFRDIERLLQDKDLNWSGIIELEEEEDNLVKAFDADLKKWTFDKCDSNPRDGVPYGVDKMFERYGFAQYGEALRILSIWCSGEGAHHQYPRRKEITSYVNKIIDKSVRSACWTLLNWHSRAINFMCHIGAGAIGNIHGLLYSGRSCRRVIRRILDGTDEIGWRCLECSRIYGNVREAQICSVIDMLKSQLVNTEKGIFKVSFHTFNLRNARGEEVDVRGLSVRPNERKKGTWSGVRLQGLYGKSYLRKKIER